MFQKSSDDGFREVAAGISLKTLVYGEKSSVTEFRLKKGAVIKLHTHPHEQNGYLVKGHMRLEIEGLSSEVFPGDSWSVPGGVIHGGDVYEDAVAIEVFTPVREDYLTRL